MYYREEKINIFIFIFIFILDKMQWAKKPSHASVPLKDLLLLCSRSDAQRSAKQKERKERELEHCAFNAENMEDGGFPLQMVSFAHAQ